MLFRDTAVSGIMARIYTLSFFAALLLAATFYTTSTNPKRATTIC
jgi:hypothetical protein